MNLLKYYIILGGIILNIKIILLDVGGVLVELTGVKRFIEFIGSGIDAEELNNLWNSSIYVTMFEKGQCDSVTFAKGFIKEFKIKISPENFLDEFVLFPKRFFPGVPELLEELRSRYIIASFSNTNLLQWSSLCERFSIDKYFHKNFLSFEMGCLKPQPEAYTYVKKALALACNPNEIIFFDDNIQNVQAGINGGMNAYRTVGAEDLKQKLNELGLLGGF